MAIAQHEAAVDCILRDREEGRNQTRQTVDVNVAETRYCRANVGMDMENAVARAEGALKGAPDGGAADARSNARVIDVVAVRYGFEIPSEQDGAIARLSASRV